MPLAIKNKEKYKVIISEEDQKEFSKLQWCQAQSVLNGICQRLESYGWEEGYRNNMAVDLMIAARMLGITEGDNNEKLIELVVNHSESWSDNNNEDLRNRIWTIENYVEQWILDNPFDYMVDENLFMRYDKKEYPIEIVFN